MDTIFDHLSDDTDTPDRSKQDVFNAFVWERESAKVKENELVAKNFIFVAVNDFVYLGTAINSNSDASLEIQRFIKEGIVAITGSIGN